MKLNKIFTLVFLGSHILEHLFIYEVMYILYQVMQGFHKEKNSVFYQLDLLFENLVFKG